MKTITTIIFALALSIWTLPNKKWQDKIDGTWRMDTGTAQMLMIVEDGYYSITSFNLEEKKFFATYGGRIQSEGDMLVMDYEFNSRDSSRVGKSSSYKFELSGEQLVLHENGHQVVWTRGDSQDTPLTGCWRITARMQNGKMEPYKQSPRKTIKILSGTHFQWVALNTETKQFFGTGGGTYTFEDGKYTEHIQFFSRDSARVGASLTFNAKVVDGVWHHEGKSSKGEPVQEQWSKH